eukprot:4799501-Pyramimonas_sp.AAC.1
MAEECGRMEDSDEAERGKVETINQWGERGGEGRRGNGNMRRIKRRWVCVGRREGREEEAGQGGEGRGKNAKLAGTFRAISSASDSSPA